MVHLPADKVQHAWDLSAPPACVVEPGTRVELDLLDASGGQLTSDSDVSAVTTLDFTRINPVTGPIYVEAARAGDRIVVRLIEVDPGSWGWSAVIPGFGLLADQFPAPALAHHVVRDGFVHLGFGPTIPRQPMVGTIGVALPIAGRHPLVPPSTFGGNMDIRHVGEGATVHLPCGVPGGLLSLGDTHAAMGDGEVGGTGVETSGRAIIEISTSPDTLPSPFIETTQMRHRVGPTLITTGISEDLWTACRDATRHMIDEVVARTKLRPEEAYMLVSITGDLIMSEVVDAPRWVATMHLPRYALD